MVLFPSDLCPSIPYYFPCSASFISLKSVLLCRGSRLQPAGAMDQAALQRVTLAGPSGTLCGTARGAREQQRLRTWIVFLFFGLEAIWLATRRGVVFFLDFLADPMVLLCCNALQVLEDTLGAPEQFCSYFPALRLRDNACFDKEFTAMASMLLDIAMRCWPCLIVPATFSPLTWHSSHVHPETPLMF